MNLPVPRFVQPSHHTDPEMHWLAASPFPLLVSPTRESPAVVLLSNSLEQAAKERNDQDKCKVLKD